MAADNPVVIALFRPQSVEIMVRGLRKGRLVVEVPTSSEGEGQMYRTACAVLVTLLGSSMLVFAQQGYGRGYGRGRGAGHHYNPATEVTLSGTVDEVKTIPGPGRGPGGMHLMIRAETGVTEVLLGPAWFVDSKKFDFAKGDNIIVTGSKLTMNNQEVVVAREVKKADKILTLRDAKGFPLWSGRGRGPKS